MITASSNLLKYLAFPVLPYLFFSSGWKVLVKSYNFPHPNRPAAEDTVHLPAGGLCSYPYYTSEWVLDTVFHLEILANSQSSRKFAGPALYQLVYEN